MSINELTAIHPGFAHQPPDSWIPSRLHVPSLDSLTLSGDALPGIGLLRDAVLNIDSRSNIICAFGEPGFGTKVSCLAVGSAPAITTRFPDGILNVPITGPLTVNLSAFLSHLFAILADRTGGCSTAAAIRYATRPAFGRPEGYVHIARNRLCEWFDTRRILLVLDHGSCLNIMQEREIVGMLKTVVGPEACFLYPTRDADIAALSDKQIEFHPVASFQSCKEIFQAYLALDLPDDILQSYTFRYIIEFCQGVHVALESMAAFVKGVYLRWGEDFLWVLEDCFGQAYHADIVESDPDIHGILSAIFSAALQCTGYVTKPGVLWEVKPYYVMLSIADDLQSGFSVPDLSLLWAIGTDATLKVCVDLASFGLATLSDNDVATSRILRLNECQVAYCRQNASRESTEMWMRIFRNRILSDQGAIPFYNDDDEYIANAVQCVFAPMTVVIFVMMLFYWNFLFVTVGWNMHRS